MLAQVMMISHVLGKAGFCRSEQYTTVRQPCDIFQHIRMFDSRHGRFAPGKRGMPGHQYARDCDGIEAAFSKPPNDYGAGVADVGFLHLLLSERLCDRDGTVEVVGMGGSEARNGS